MIKFLFFNIFCGIKIMLGILLINLIKFLNWYRIVICLFVEFVIE